jgi:hypothetical protein
MMTFFLVRILVLRLPPKDFGEMFQNIWPLLYNQINYILVDGKQDENLSLKQGTIKLLETLMISDYDRLWNYIWNLGVDTPYFSIKPKEN